MEHPVRRSTGGVTAAQAPQTDAGRVPQTDGDPVHATTRSQSAAAVALVQSPVVAQRCERLVAAAAVAADEKLEGPVAVVAPLVVKEVVVAVQQQPVVAAARHRTLTLMRSAVVEAGVRQLAA